MAQLSQKLALLRQNFASELLLMYQDKEIRGALPPYFLFIINQEHVKGSRRAAVHFTLDLFHDL